MEFESYNGICFGLIGNNYGVYRYVIASIGGWKIRSQINPIGIIGQNTLHRNFVMVLMEEANRSFCFLRKPLEFL